MTELEKNDYVSGKFLKCLVDYNVFHKGEKYWLEYLGNDTYIGRSDNILNEKFYLKPERLYYFVSEDEEHNYATLRALIELVKRTLENNRFPLETDEMFYIRIAHETEIKIR